MKSNRLALSVIAILLFSVCLSFGQNAVGDEKGILPYGTYQGGDVDQIDVKNGNVNIRIPLFSLPELGKLKLSYSLVYSGQPFDTVVTDVNGDNGYGETYIQSGLLGPTLSMDQALYGDINAPLEGVPGQGPIYQPPSYTVVDGGWARHTLMFDASNLNNLHAFDGSGYTYESLPDTYPYDELMVGPWDPNFGPHNCTGVNAELNYDGNTIVTSDGVKHVHQEQCGTSFGAFPATVMSDPSGNSIDYTWKMPVDLGYGTYFPSVPFENVGAVTDNVGRTIPDLDSITLSSDVSMCPNLGVSNEPATGSKTWQVPGPNGANASYIFCFANVSINTRFGGDLSGANALTDSDNESYDPELIGTEQVIQSVKLPNGKYWGFIYDSAAPLETYVVDGVTEDDPSKSNEAYGEITEVLLPTGGSISYTYQSMEDCSSTKQYKRMVTARTVNDDNGGSSIWQYSYQNPTARIIDNIAPAGFDYGSEGGTTPVATVTDPDGNDTVHTFTALTASGEEFSICSSFGETETDQYNGTLAGGSGTRLKTTIRTFSPQVEPRVTNAAYNQQPNMETETVTNGATVTTNYYYPTLFSYEVPVCVNADNPPDDCPINEGPSAVQYGQPTEQQITSSDANSQKTIQTAYKWQSDSTFLSNNYLSYPLTVETDYANGTEAGKTTYGYDTQANLKSISQDVTAGNPIVTQSATYNSEGMPNTTTDGDGNTTTIGYDGLGLFPSEIQRPITSGSTQHNDYYSYDDNTGNVKLHTDENGATTNYLYDLMGRLTGVTDPPTAAGQGNTTYCYTDTGGTGCSAGSAPYSVYATTTASPDPTQQVIRNYDGLGRLIRSTMASDPEGAVSVDTVYNGDGEVAKVSNPYRGSASAWTQYAYDGLGRVAVQTQPDNSTLQWCYNNVATNGQTCSSFLGSGTPYTWVDFEDEINNHWQRSSDYFSNLTQVLEPNPMPTLLTTYQYNPLNNLTNVNQAGTGSDTARTRTFSYDGLSRLLSASNPESGTTTYTYDKSSNVLTKIDARSITTTYTYDALNRVTGRSYQNDPNETPSTCFLYDTNSSNTPPNANGRLTAEWTQNGACPANATGVPSSGVATAKVVTSYDAMGRLLTQLSCILANCTQSSYHPQTFAYDTDGKLSSYDDGSGLQTFSESYDAAGRLQFLTSNWYDATHPATLYGVQNYGPFGVLNAVMGDHLTIRETYDPLRERLTTLMGGQQ